MKKNQNKKDQFFIDVDGAVKAYNENNPDDKLNREKLSEKLGVTYQCLMNYQHGRIPNITATLVKITEITGVSLESLIKPK